MKNQIIADHDTSLNGTEFDLYANPMRPNGGVLGRGFTGLTIPIIGITFYGPTQNSCGDTCVGDDLVLPTNDFAQEYDFLGGDAPARPGNILAIVNSIAAYAQLHGSLPDHSVDGPGVIDQGQDGDTHYYMLAADTLPILLPLVTAGVPAPALAIPDAIMRVWIEDAYIRDQSPGASVPFQLSPIGDPIGLIGNTLGAIPVGIDDTVEGFTTPGNRPLQTPGGWRPFGVGGGIYDRTTGQPVEEAATLGAREAAPVTPAPQTGDTKKAEIVPDADDQGNDDTQQTPPARQPGPVRQFIRESLNFDPTKRPSGLAPNGEGPLKKVFNALTGQRPKKETDNETGDEQKPAANDPAQGAA